MLKDFRRYDLPKLISQIRCPVMLLHSPADKTVSYDHALRIFGLIQAAGLTSASLVALHKADHLLSQNPANIEWVAGLVAHFNERYFVL